MIIVLLFYLRIVVFILKKDTFKYDNHIGMIEVNMEFEVTRLGERGQIVIPLIFRENLRLKKGEKFIIVEQNGTILLKRLEPPTKEEFAALLKKTREHARKNNLTEEDLNKALTLARK